MKLSEKHNQFFFMIPLHHLHITHTHSYWSTKLIWNSW